MLTFVIGADAAQQREQQKAPDQPEAAIAIGAVGDLVVEREIARHRRDRRGDLAVGEIHGAERRDQAQQDRQMNEEADAADRGEQHEADRQHAAGRVMHDQAEKVEADQRRKL